MAFQRPPAVAAAPAAATAAGTATPTTTATAAATTGIAGEATAGDQQFKRAALFPGQGAQCLGMGVAAAKTHPPSMRLFNEASEILGLDLLSLCENGPIETLNKTDMAQPALLTASLAAYTKWRDTEKEAMDFDVCGGLSLGEFSALCFAGVLSFKDAVSLTAKRGALMQAAAEANPGEMYAVLGLGKEETERLCAEVAQADPTGYCGVANYLCKGNYAVSVSRSGVEILQKRASAAKAKRCVKLATAGAFHSPLMKPAADGLQKALESVEFHEPRIPIILNVDAQIHTKPQIIKEKLLLQLSNPTQWQQSMETLGSLGLQEAIEFGPGAVLTKLMNKINPSVTATKVE